MQCHAKDIENNGVFRIISRRHIISLHWNRSAFDYCYFLGEKKIIKSSSKLRHLLSFPCLLSTVWNVLLIHKNCCSLENTWFYACLCVTYIKTYEASFRKHKVPGNNHESLLLMLYMQFVVPLWIFILFSMGIAWKKKIKYKSHLVSSHKYPKDL